jgi:type II secretory ATPase GspE/PulE/Tfp pilus assembly ATPase PilB-like protein
VAQSEVNPSAGLDLAGGLRAMMRQDPEVIMVGEIRDRSTAQAAMRAALTGHLLLTSFHAGSAAESVSRLLDMGIEPYVLRSGLLAVLNQRLLRKLCPCARPIRDFEAMLGLPVNSARTPVGCPECGNAGYRGRLLLVEMLCAQPAELGEAILDCKDTHVLERLAIESGMTTRWQNACAMIEAGLTSPVEVRRVLGFSGG